MENTPNNQRIAILIDAENVIAAHAELIFAQAEAMGEIIAKEIYGTAAALTAWVAPVLKYAIHPNLTIRASKGKNSSDIALVIGAMDLLLSGGVDTVMLASSDSDFSALSVRLRNAGVNVVGMGMEKSNALWRTACSSFVVLDHPAPTAKPQPAPAQEAAPAPAQAEPPKDARKGAANRQARAAAPTHKERVSIIEQFIQKRLDSSGGYLQVGSLFTGLNKLPEYKTDRQGSGRKPLNYLSSTFAEVFQFVNSADGKTWVSRVGAEPLPAGAEPARDGAPEEAEEAAAQTPAEAEAPVETLPEAEPAQDSPEVETTPEAPESDSAALSRRLVEGGMDDAVAGTIADIFMETSNLRAAYNQIRKTYGNVEGREYYHQARGILDNE